MINAEEFARKAAEKNGWALNPDGDFLAAVAKGLEASREAHGYFLCPCREGWGMRDRDRGIICPCDYAGDDIEEYGHCYCGLFFSEERAKSGEAAGSIPDRRPDELYPD